MRDPDGRISFSDRFVIRTLNEPAAQDHFLHSSLAKRWVQEGFLPRYNWLAEDKLQVHRLPFVSLPTEWTARQFYVAGRLTLQLQAEANAEGWDLKDASAWNIVFHGLRPVFVDLLSFQGLGMKSWRAAGQFSRHFILPLLLDRYHLMQPRQCFELWRDGVPTEAARNILGWRRFASRYWPLMSKESVDSDAAIIASIPSRLDGNERISPGAANWEQIQDFRRGLQEGFNWFLAGVKPKRQEKVVSTWGKYETTRQHYDDLELDFKRKTVAQWLCNLRPKWVLDVGANAGEFSELAASTGASVVCWDSDPQALSILVKRNEKSNFANLLYPVLNPIDDISGGRGWRGSEFPSLTKRLGKRFDAVMLLAVIHHLTIAGSLRIEDVFKFFVSVSKKSILAEIIHDNDPKIRQLCAFFGRDVSEFSAKNQYAAAKSAGLRLTKVLRYNAAATREYAMFEIA